MKNSKKSISILRWTARIIGAFAAGLLLIIFIIEGISDGIEPFLPFTERETLIMVTFIMLWSGLIVGWKWELIGGILSTCGLIALTTIDIYFFGSLLAVPIFLIFAAPSLIFLYLGIKYKE